MAHRKSMRVGGGGRFQALKEKLEHKGGVKDAGAVAAAIGRKKYGRKRFARMSHHRR